MAIIGAHMLLYSSEADSLRTMLRDTFGFNSVDAGGGWLIFALPPSELGVHPAEGPTYKSGIRHQVSFMCDDIRATVGELRAKGVQIQGEPEDEGWGITVTMTLPGGVEVMASRSCCMSRATRWPSARRRRAHRRRQPLPKPPAGDRRGRADRCANRMPICHNTAA